MKSKKSNYKALPAEALAKEGQIPKRVLLHTQIAKKLHVDPPRPAFQAPLQEVINAYKQFSPKPESRKLVTRYLILTKNPLLNTNFSILTPKRAIFER